MFTLQETQFYDMKLLLHPAEPPSPQITKEAPKVQIWEVREEGRDTIIGGSATSLPSSASFRALAFLIGRLGSTPPRGGARWPYLRVDCGGREFVPITVWNG